MCGRHWDRWWRRRRADDAVVDVEGFQSGSFVHALAVAVCVAAAATACALGRRWRDSRPGAERRLRLGWAAFTLLTQAFIIVWWLLPANFSWRASLPLHICDVVAVLAAAALVVERRWLRAVVYFWGIGLSLIAFIMPVLTEGPAHVHFYLFWLTHLEIVGSALYLVMVMRLRPRWGDWRIAVGLLAGYYALVVPVNVMLGTYYGYIGPGASKADVLGPWPLRAVVMLMLEVVGLTLLLVPWLFVRRQAESRH